uniref:Uncharacterized protein n=1 Tax=Meloidogyne incognita TaxID=6306 RepID=A0A914KFW7_MELIC
MRLFLFSSCGGRKAQTAWSEKHKQHGQVVRMFRGDSHNDLINIRMEAHIQNVLGIVLQLILKINYFFMYIKALEAQKIVFYLGVS